MSIRYVVEPFGTAVGIFRKPVDPDKPILILYDMEAAEDLATSLNWAAADRERHASLAASE